MTTSGHSADAHGFTSCEPNLTNNQKCGQKLETRMERKLAMDRVHQSLPGDVHATSQRKQTLTILGTCWQGNMFTGKNKADTR